MPRLIERVRLPPSHLALVATAAPEIVASSLNGDKGVKSVAALRAAVELAIAKATADAMKGQAEDPADEVTPPAPVLTLAQDIIALAGRLAGSPVTDDADIADAMMELNSAMATLAVSRKVDAKNAA